MELRVTYIDGPFVSDLLLYFEVIHNFCEIQQTINLFNKIKSSICVPLIKELHLY